MEASDKKEVREALEYLRDASRDFCHLILNSKHNEIFDKYKYTEVAKIRDAIANANAALSAPIRNCDIGTAEEQARRYDNFAGRYNPCSYKGNVRCAEDCPVHRKLTQEGHGELLCQLEWAQMPYKADEGDHLADTEKLRDALTRIATATSFWKKAGVTAETAIQHCHDIAMSALTTAERKGETNGSK